MRLPGALRGVSAAVWVAGGAAVLLVVLAVVAGPEHDYVAYLQQWAGILAGDDPWLTRYPRGRNAYGPLHNLFAPLAAVWPLGPKVIFVIAFGAGGVAVTAGARRAWPGRPTWALAVAALAVANPFVLVWVGAYGANDALVAPLCLAAVLLATGGRRSVTAGALLGLAALLKLYPLVFVPFLAVDRRRFDWRLIGAAAGVVAAGFAIGFALWGPSTLRPIFWAAEREVKLLALAAFLGDSSLSPFAGAAHRLILSRVAMLALGAALAATWAAHLALRLDRLSGVVIAALTVVALYPLGHFQLELPLLLLVPAWAAAHRLDLGAQRRLVAAAVVAFGLLFALGVGFWFLGAYRTWPFVLVRRNAGLPMFLASAWLLLEVWRRARALATA